MNRVIAINYELRDVDSGTILESNMEHNPLYFITGFNHVIKELEEALLDTKANDEKIITLPKNALGEYDAALVQAYPKEDFAGIELFEGMELTGQGEDGSIARAIVMAIGEDEVMMDFNNPLAGKNLEFSVKVTENRLATEEEIAGQRADTPHSCGCGTGGCGSGHSHGDDHECCGGSGDGCCGGEHHHEEESHGCCGGGHCGSH
ncbi:MAG: peptidylprolyl isomerase [Campylobacteraceae bacterium]|nr:peptidylprolyl isomerase [Campylobacteraceae bacterium]